MHLTKRQKLIYDFIASSIETNGYAPSIVEIGDHFGLSSPATIHKHLTNLESKGLIRRTKNLSRAIELVEKTEESFFRRQAEVPLAGYIAAGVPVEAYQLDETVFIPEDMLGKRDTYVLKVRGDSMIEDSICDGDFVIIEGCDYANNGETVVALVDNDSATLKKFYKENGHIRLQPANSGMEPIILPAESVTIQGVVIGLLRKF